MKKRKKRSEFDVLDFCLYMEIFFFLTFHVYIYHHAWRAWSDPFPFPYPVPYPVVPNSRQWLLSFRFVVVSCKNRILREIVVYNVHR
jgi:hypothetical protein